MYGFRLLTPAVALTNAFAFRRASVTLTLQNELAAMRGVSASESCIMQAVRVGEGLRGIGEGAGRII